METVNHVCEMTRSHLQQVEFIDIGLGLIDGISGSELMPRTETAWVLVKLWSRYSEVKPNTQ